MFWGCFLIFVFNSFILYGLITVGICPEHICMMGQNISEENKQINSGWIEMLFSGLKMG